MEKYMNDCCGCANYCADCGRKHRLHIICDRCGNDTGMEYETIDDEDVCMECYYELTDTENDD